MTGSIVPVSLEKSELVSSFINQKKVSSFLADPSSTGVGFSFTGTRLESLSLSSLSAGQIEFFYFTPGYIDEVLRDPYTLTLSGTTSTGVTLINFRNQKVLRAYDGTILDSVDLILQNSRISLSFPLA